MDTAAAKGKSRHHPFPWLNLMVTEPFFLLHLLTFFSYFAARSFASHTFSPDTSHRLLHWEIQAILTFSVLTAVKFVKEETWEAFIADTLLYAKGFLFVLALAIDYHVALGYVVVFAAIFVLARQPPYDGLGDSSHLTPLQLESLLTEGNTSRFWLVEFRATCSSLCIRTSRIFPELSTIYANKHISFGIVDLGHFPTAAEKFGIPFGGSLPTYVLFENAIEVGRFPDFNSILQDSSATITKKDLGLRRVYSAASAMAPAVTIKDMNYQSMEPSEAKIVECECCGMSEECTPTYISRIKDSFTGKWVCGICSEAVKEKMKRAPAMAVEEAVESHMSFCKQFNETIRLNPKLYLAGAMRDIARKSSQHRRSSMDVCSPKISRTISCGPRMGVETTRGSFH